MEETKGGSESPPVGLQAIADASVIADLNEKLTSDFFLVDGDALLAALLDSPTLGKATVDTVSPLSLLYSFEAFLSRLLGAPREVNSTGIARERYRVIFARGNRQLWEPAIQYARSIIISHVKKSLNCIDVIPAATDAHFLEVLKSLGPNVLFTRLKFPKESQFYSSSLAQAVQLAAAKAMAGAQKVTLALLSSTGALGISMSFGRYQAQHILPFRGEAAHELLRSLTEEEKSLAAVYDECTRTVPVEFPVEDLEEASHEKILLCVGRVCAHLLRNNEGINLNSLLDFCKIVMLHAAVLPLVPLERRLRGFMLRGLPRAFIASFLTKLAAVVERFPPSYCQVFDVFDPRVFIAMTNRVSDKPEGSLSFWTFGHDKVSPEMEAHVHEKLNLAKKAWSESVGKEEVAMISTTVQTGFDGVTSQEIEGHVAEHVPHLLGHFARTVLVGSEFNFTPIERLTSPTRPYMISTFDSFTIEQDSSLAESTEEKEYDREALLLNEAREEVLWLCNHVHAGPAWMTWEVLEALPSFGSIADRVLKYIKLGRLRPQLRDLRGRAITELLVRAVQENKNKKRLRGGQVQARHRQHRARFETAEPVRVVVGKLQPTRSRVSKREQKKDLIRLHTMIDGIENTVRSHLLPEAAEAKEDTSDFRPQIAEARVAVARFVSEDDLPLRRRDDGWLLVRKYAESRGWEGDSMASLRACVLYLRVVTAEWFTARQRWLECSRQVESQSPEEKALDLILSETNQIEHNRLTQAIGEAKEAMGAKRQRVEAVTNLILNRFGDNFTGKVPIIETQFQIRDTPAVATERSTLPQLLTFILSLYSFLGHVEEAEELKRSLSKHISANVTIHDIPEEGLPMAWHALMELGWANTGPVVQERLSLPQFRKLHDDIMLRAQAWRSQVERARDEARLLLTMGSEGKGTEDDSNIAATMEKAEAAAGYLFAGITEAWMRFSRALTGESDFDSDASVAGRVADLITLLRNLGVPEAAQALHSQLRQDLRSAPDIMRANTSAALSGWKPGVSLIYAGAKFVRPCATMTETLTSLPSEDTVAASDREHSRLLSIAIAQAVADAAAEAPTLSSAQFQLLCADQYLKRTEGLVDSRMEPLRLDDWQRRMLDVVDRNESGLIVAPTSAGKSFIAYYVIKKILEEDPDATICFVVPTKALVNQIVVDTVTRLNITPVRGGRHPTGIFNPDWRNQEFTSNILITVPECLEVCLLDQRRSTSWTPSIRYTVFDEVHNLHGQNGAIWERLLLHGSFPFLAMSATIGNVMGLHQWLQRALPDTTVPVVIDTRLPARGQQAGGNERKGEEEEGIDIDWPGSEEEDGEDELGETLEEEGGATAQEMEWRTAGIEAGEAASDNDDRPEDAEGIESKREDNTGATREQNHHLEVNLIQHKVRWNDLVFHVWSRGKGLVPISPLAGLTVEDIAQGHQSLYSTRLTPRQAVAFYQVLLEATEELGMDTPELAHLKLALAAIRPDSWFGARGVDMIGLDETYDYERKIKACLQYFAQVEPGAVRAMLAKMHHGIEEAVEPLVKCVENSSPSGDFLTEYLLPYLRSMQYRGRLPMICFAMDADMLEDLAKQIGTALRNMEDEAQQRRFGRADWRAEIKRKIDGYERERRDLEDQISSLPEGHRNNPDNELRIRMEATGAKIVALRKELAPQAEYCFGNLSQDEVAEALYLDKYQRDRSSAIAKIEEPAMGETLGLRASLVRGIGVHHEALAKQYRSAVEDLFGGGRLPLVLATDTLAQGINMPCRTVTFLMDSPYLNGINFQQMSGRAGRRGFDHRGDVVLLAVPKRKLLRLVTSPPPLLQGNSLLDATTLLRLDQAFANAPTDATKATLATWLRRMIHHPFIAMGKDRNTLANQFRYHIAFLFAFMQRNEYYTPRGLLRNDTIVASHSWYRDPVNHVFQAALFKRVLDIALSRTENDEEMFKILAYFFTEEYLSDDDSFAGGQRMLSLQDLAGGVPEFLHEFHSSTRSLHDAFLRAYCAAHHRELPNMGTFPLTQFVWQEEGAGLLPPQSSEDTSADVRSPFVPRRGPVDAFLDHGELMLTARHGLHVDACPVPELPAYQLPRNNFHLLLYRGHSISQLIKTSGLGFEHLYKATERFLRTLRSIATVRTLVEKKELARQENIRNWAMFGFFESRYSPLTQCLRRIARDYEQIRKQKFAELLRALSVFVD